MEGRHFGLLPCRNTSLHSNEQATAAQVRLQPLLRLTAPGVNGTQLVLPGNWTEDGDGLTARLAQAAGQQLPLGPYLLEASLNGRDFAGGRGGRDWVSSGLIPFAGLLAL